jgi:hypothetical protein
MSKAKKGKVGPCLGQKRSIEARQNMIKSSKSAKPIIIDDVEYVSAGSASIELNISKNTIQYRLQSGHYPNYCYKN